MTQRVEIPLHTRTPSSIHSLHDSQSTISSYLQAPTLEQFQSTKGHCPKPLQTIRYSRCLYKETQLSLQSSMVTLPCPHKQQQSALDLFKLGDSAKPVQRVWPFCSTVALILQSINTNTSHRNNRTTRDTMKKQKFRTIPCFAQRLKMGARKTQKVPDTYLASLIKDFREKIWRLFKEIKETIGTRQMNHK